MRRVIAVGLAVWWLMTGWAFSSDSRVVGGQNITGIGPFFLGMTIQQLRHVLPDKVVPEEWVGPKGEDTSILIPSQVVPGVVEDKDYTKWCGGMKAYIGGSYLVLNGRSREVQVAVCVEGDKVQVMQFRWPMHVFSGGIDLYNSMRWLVDAVERAYGLSMEQREAGAYIAQDEKGSVVQVMVEDHWLTMMMGTQKGWKRLGSFDDSGLR